MAHIGTKKKSSTVAGSVMAMVPLQMAMDLGDPPVSNPKGPKPCCGTCNQCHSSSGDMGWKCGNHLNGQNWGPGKLRVPYLLDPNRFKDDTCIGVNMFNGLNYRCIMMQFWIQT